MLDKTESGEPLIGVALLARTDIVGMLHGMLQILATMPGGTPGPLDRLLPGVLDTGFRVQSAITDPTLIRKDHAAGLADEFDRSQHDPTSGVADIATRCSAEIVVSDDLVVGGGHQAFSHRKNFRAVAGIHPATSALFGYCDHLIVFHL